MKIKDAPRAAAAGQLLFLAFVGNAGLTVLYFLVTTLVPSAFDGPWPIIEEVLWVGIGIVVVAALFQLASALEDGGLAIIAALGWILSTLFDAGSTALMLLQRYDVTLLSLPTALSGLPMLVSLAARAALFFLFAQLTLERRPWVMPLAALSWLISAARIALSFAVMFQVVSPEVYRGGFLSVGLGAVTFLNTALVLAAAWGVRLSLQDVPGSSGVPITAQAGLVPAAPQPENPAADFVVGAILLAVGIGVTVVSLSAASSGGRYIVATGAIGVGLGRLIRGFIRLAKRTS